jgi:hypothetical protein
MNNSSKSGLTDKFKPPATKVCRLCKQELPIKKFSVSFKGRHGYANECRGCKKAHEDHKTEQRREKAKTFFDARFYTLLLVSMLTGSLDGRSQERTLENPPKPVDGRSGIAAEGDTSGGGYIHSYDRYTVNHRTPDTLRAIILVTLSPNGIAHARMGYVVIEQGKRPVYLDCRKRALKLPAVGWGWERVGVKE